MEWLSEIRKLRKNVPVGIQVARRLLERTGGDVDEAIKLFHIDQINILTAKADVTHQEAENVLLLQTMILQKLFGVLMNNAIH